MSATSCRLEFAFTVEDSKHWSPQHLERCDQDDPGSYDGWVSGQLEAAMRAAGEKFIAEHPDLFRGEYLI